MTDITYGIETITPELATEMLERNITSNRGMSSSRVELMLENMRDGSWYFNGDPIRIADSGELIDGQHRLTAIKRSGSTQKMLVIRGLDTSVIETIDLGGKRSLANQLHFLGYKNTSRLATTLSEVLHMENYLSDKFRKDGVTPVSVHSRNDKVSYIAGERSIFTRRAALHVMDRRPTLEKSVQSVMAAGQRLTGGIAVLVPIGAVMHNIASNHGAGGASVVEFMDSARHGGGDMDDPARKLANILQRRKEGHPNWQMSHGQTRAITLRAYNAWMGVEEITQLTRARKGALYPWQTGDTDWYLAGLERANNE